VVADLGPWQYVDNSHRIKAYANQGLATVVGADGSTSLVYRGDASIPDRLKGQGWVLIGDPDSSQGYIFDVYQAQDGGTSKMTPILNSATPPTGGPLTLAPRSLSIGRSATCRERRSSMTPR
jgi:hypothetical protein